jgi:hypothetical protein
MSAALARIPPVPQHHVVLPGQSPNGAPILAVLVKRSYRIVSEAPAVRLERAEPLVPGDRHFGDPMNSTVAFESDHVPFKPATDVVVHASAFAPGGARVHELVASIVVGSSRKNIVVIGDREARYREGGDPEFTDPLPFSEMLVRYENAYGGVDVRSDPSMALPYARNHLGRGFVVRNAKEAVDGVQLPNIEAPDDRLTPERLCCGHVMYWERQPPPDGIGWFSKYWQPRASRAGVMPGDRVMEQRLRRDYARAVPVEQRADYAKTAIPDMDFAFFNGASKGMVHSRLGPGERIAFRNLHESGDVIGALPNEWPAISLDIGKGPASAQRGVLQTVMVRLNDLAIDMVWRAAFPYPGLDWLPRMRRLHVEIGEA